MTTLTVGPGEQYSTIAAAVAASSSGDTVNVDAGTYTNDVLNISHSLSLQAVGGTVNLVATEQPANGKSIVDAGGPGVNVSISGFDISGVTVPDQNGAGVRYEGGNLTLTNDTIHGNQNGLLANPDAGGSITIANSNFYGNGGGDGSTHNIYVGAVGSLTVQDSTITAANVGHDIKSRAARTTITGNTITDGPSGTASYEIDLPNGGVGVIRNNTIEKGPNAQNPIAITSGEEGVTYADNGLTVTGNTITSDYTAHSSTAVANKTGVAATISGNQLYGWTTIASGPADVSGNTVQASGPAPDSTPLGSTTAGSTMPNGAEDTPTVPAGPASGTGPTTPDAPITATTPSSVAPTGTTTGSSTMPSSAGDTSTAPAGSATGSGPSAPDASGPSSAATGATTDMGSNATVPPASLGLAPAGFIADGSGSDAPQGTAADTTQGVSSAALYRLFQSFAAAAVGLPGAAQAFSAGTSESDKAASQFWSSLSQSGTTSAASLLGLDRHASGSAHTSAVSG